MGRQVIRRQVTGKQKHKNPATRRDTELHKERWHNCPYDAAKATSVVAGEEVHAQHNHQRKHRSRLVCMVYPDTAPLAVSPAGSSGNLNDVFLQDIDRMLYCEGSQSTGVAAGVRIQVHKGSRGDVPGWWYPELYIRALSSNSSPWLGKFAGLVLTGIADNCRDCRGGAHIRCRFSLDI